MTEEKPIENFKVADAPKAGTLGRLFGRVQREAAFVEIRNMLATTPYEQVRESDVAAVLAKSKLLPRDATKELVGIYEHAAQVLAQDEEISDADRRGLVALQRAFELTDDETKEALEGALGNVFQRAMREAPQVVGRVLRL